MPSTSKKQRPGLTGDIDELQKYVQVLNTQNRRYNSVRYSMAIAFLKGVASALGAIATVVIVMPVIVWFLQSVNWPPLIADMVSEITLQLERARRP